MVDVRKDKIIRIGTAGGAKLSREGRGSMVLVEHTVSNFYLVLK